MTSTEQDVIDTPSRSSPDDKGGKDILMFLAKADEPQLVDAFMHTLMYAAELKGEVAALRQRLLEANQ